MLPREQRYPGFFFLEIVSEGGYKTAKENSENDKSGGNIDVIHIRFIARNISNKEASRLRNFFDQIKLLTALW